MFLIIINAAHTHTHTHRRQTDSVLYMLEEQISWECASCFLGPAVPKHTHTCVVGRVLYLLLQHHLPL